MSSFDLAIGTILRREGGYTFVAEDAGGETNFGISKRSYPDLDIKSLTSADASAIYRRDFWEKYGYGRILAQSIATKVLDMSVNMGPEEAHKTLQRAISAIPGPTIDVDGVFGPQTVRATNDSPAAILLQKTQDQQAARYREIVAARPQDAEFLSGWLRRAYDRC